jgi:hypothetical protein
MQDSHKTWMWQDEGRMAPAATAAAGGFTGGDDGHVSSCSSDSGKSVGGLTLSCRTVLRTVTLLCATR